MLYYINDAFMVLTCFIVLKVRVQKHPQAQKTEDAFKKILSLPTVIFFSIMATTGLQWGCRSGLYAIYLQDDLGADAQLISSMIKSNILRKKSCYDFKLYL